MADVDVDFHPINNNVIFFIEGGNCTVSLNVTKPSTFPASNTEGYTVEFCPGGNGNGNPGFQPPPH